MAKTKLVEYNVKAAPIRAAINRRPLIDFYMLEGSEKTGYTCPVCKSGTGSNHTGALFITKDNHVTCFSSSHPAGANLSGKGTDTLGALREILGDVSEREVFEFCGYDLDTGERRKDAKPLPPIKSPAREEKEPQPLNDYRPEVTKYHAALHGSEAESYLLARGFTAVTLADEHWQLGYTDDPQWGKCVVIPYPDTPNGYYIKRKISEKKYIKLKRDEGAGAEPLFNPNALYSGAKAVFVVESQLCAISIEQSGGKAVAIGGQGAEKLIKLIKERPTASTLIVCLDNDPHELIKAPSGTEVYKDEQTMEKAKNLTENLMKAGAKAMIDNSICGASKDPNDAMKANPEEFAAAIQRSTAAVEAHLPEAADPEINPAEKTPEATNDELALYMSKNASSHLESLDKTIEESSRKRKIKTGFHGLDKKIGGGLFPGLYIVGACTSLGKTAWTMQIIDQIAENGTDCLVFALEMSQDELIARSESRLTFQYARSDEGKRNGYSEENAKTQIGIMDGELYDEYTPRDIRIIQYARNEYRRRYGEHIWITEGMRNIGTQQIREGVENHIRITHRKPVVLVDYLQTLAQYTSNDMSDKQKWRNLTDKQNVEENILDLKRISRDNDIPIIVISAFNRTNYTEPVNSAAFKESGMIEYTADVLIGLQYTGMEYKVNPKGKDSDGNTEYEIEESREHEKRVMQLLKRIDIRSEAGEPIKIDVKIMKNRKGARGMSSTMQFYPRFLTFIEDSGETPKKKKGGSNEIAAIFKR